MLITVLVLSGTILGATTIAGLLTLYQIRQTTDFINSTKAIYAADSGLEWRLYKFFKKDGYSCKDCPDGEACPPPIMSNISSPVEAIKTKCESISGAGTTTVIKSTGTSNKASRAFESSWKTGPRIITGANPTCSAGTTEVRKDWLSAMQQGSSCCGGSDCYTAAGWAPASSPPTCSTVLYYGGDPCPAGCGPAGARADSWKAIECQ